MLEVTDRPQQVEKAYLIGVQLPSMSAHEAEVLLDELEELVKTLGIEVVQKKLVKIREYQTKMLLGTGKAQEILDEVKELGCDVVVFDEELTPGQQRNWEKESKITVVDRQEVILDIFARRAQTKEAVLQVELARQEYYLPRLRKAWSHLGRQRGGGAMQRSEGETQLEADQRMVRKRISALKKELAEVVQHRQVQRKRRMKIPLPTAAIIGYTNAGKSSLLNKLTGAKILAEDKLFATLDPTTRRLELPRGQVVLLTDTVGFVRRLPHRLVDAFRATLEEAVVGDFLIHVVDISSPDLEHHMQTTLNVVKELGAQDKNIITVFNKIDLEDAEEKKGIVDANLEGPVCYISTKTGQGLEELQTHIEAQLQEMVQSMTLLVPHDSYDIVHKLHEAGAVKREEVLDEGIKISGNIPLRLVPKVQQFEI